MPNTLTEKALRQPFRVGIMLGALTLPTLWVATKDVWNWLQGLHALNSEEVTWVFAQGFLPGMVLGAGALRAWAAWRAGEVSRARWLLISHGGLVTLVAGAFLARWLQNYQGILRLNMKPPPQILSHTMPMWFHYLLRIADAVPLQIALAMFLLGLFMRGKNL